MRKSILLAIMTTFSLGCENEAEYSMIVDSNCSESNVDSIQYAMDQFNDVVDETAFEIKRIEDIDYDGKFSNMVICTPDIERWPALEGLSGRKTGDNIFLRTDIMNDDDAVTLTMMHEMIHLIGASNDDHSDDPLDIFYRYHTGYINLEYTENDIEIINKFY